MNTVKIAKDVTDFAAFKTQRVAVQREANIVIAEKVALIQKTLAEIGKIANDTGVDVNCYGIASDLSELRDNSERGWNSSDNC